MSRPVIKILQPGDEPTLEPFLIEALEAADNAQLRTECGVSVQRSLKERRAWIKEEL